MSFRPLAFVSGLTLGDYLLWNWSLNANHDVLALASGLALPPLALACAWMLALSLLRAIGGTRRSGRAAASARARAADDRAAIDAGTARSAVAAGGKDGAGASPSSSGKLAA